jgi:broad-specificity NMP kinase
MNARKLPNIIITGTPGVGKTTHCESLAERTGLRHLSVNQVVKDKECHEGWSDEFHSLIVDEDKVSLCSLVVSTRFMIYESLSPEINTQADSIIAA